MSSSIGMMRFPIYSQYFWENKKLMATSHHQSDGIIRSPTVHDLIHVWKPPAAPIGIIMPDQCPNCTLQANAWKGKSSIYRWCSHENRLKPPFIGDFFNGFSIAFRTSTYFAGVHCGIRSGTMDHSCHSLHGFPSPKHPHRFLTATHSNINQDESEYLWGSQTTWNLRPGKTW